MPNPNLNDAKVWVGHNYDPSHGHDKIYIAVIDDLGNGHYAVRGYYGKREAANLIMVTKCSSPSMATCERAWNDLIDSKGVKRGYRDVTDANYTQSWDRKYRITVEEAMKKIDCTRLVGYSPPSNTVPTQKFTNQPGGKVVKPKKIAAPKSAPAPCAGKAQRSIRF
jgi:hypothetical protein